MALNFPQNPEVDDTYTDQGTTWQWDGVAWNVVTGDTTRNIFVNFSVENNNLTFIYNT